MDIMITKPIPRKAIWGYDKLKTYFNYESFPYGIGQSWSFSDQEDGSNYILEGMHSGMTIKQIWQQYPSYFDSKKEYFPFIVGLVAPEDNLSIQIHPNADIAKKYGLMSGKNEAWYFIEAEPNSDLVYGTTAKDKDEFISLVHEQKWDELLQRKTVKRDDFVYVPAGILHAMQKGVITYEVQEATDITYRFYDYDRVDANGKKRELHIEKAIESLEIFNQPTTSEPVVVENEGYQITTYIANETFKIKKYTIKSACTIVVEDYMLVTIIRGNGKVNGHSLKFGDSFIVPITLSQIEVEGCMEFMVTQEGRM